MNKKEFFVVWISLTALLLAVIAICIAVWRSPELSFDYQGVITGVLSLLVTVLIGWNIYALYDYKQAYNHIKKDHEQIKVDMKKSFDLLSLKLYSSIFEQLARDGKYDFLYYQLGLLSVMYCVKLDDFQKISIYMNSMCHTIADIKLKDYEKNILVGILYKIPDSDKIPKYNYIRDAILNFHVSDDQKKGSSP